jgi:putative Mg2+ transporter-C (MgtC) family protein
MATSRISFEPGLEGCHEASLLESTRKRRASTGAMSDGKQVPVLAVAVVQLAVAFALALPVGWNRERKSRSAGLRTYPLAAIAACAFVLAGQRGLGSSPSQQADVLYGLLSGVAIFAAGAILTGEEAYRGLGTAAALWVTAAMGAAVAHGLYGLAIALSLFTFVALQRGRRADAGKP